GTGDGEGDGDGEGLGEGEGEGLGVVDGLGDADGLGEGTGDGLGDGPTEGLGAGLGDAAGVEPGDGVGSVATAVGAATSSAAITLPVRRAEDAIAAMLDQVPDEPGIVVGGHSFGGRVASLAAAGIGTAARSNRFAALICYSYPLHRPGDTAHLRADHWPQITCPVLLVSGEADPLARLE